ncbi:83_t:CDS:2 [Funneliformis caledonium]|uniref:83_t:CDS:1 n=1 Tax=Funneliformis caledonium TaxID=1117310 RepID=A0A9N9EWC2_9GLOM|nr:83_t:CDS:2 [Funneliformis caledonium]
MNNNQTIRYCDWRIELYDCPMSELWVAQVTIAAVTYILLAISGTFTFGYRFKYNWHGLFVDHGNGIRPLPVDSLLFFWTIACYLRGLHSLFMLLQVYTRYWQREFMQEIGWTMFCFGGILYLVGIIYTIPVNYSSGTAATIKIESKKDPLNYFTSREIYIPTPNMLNIIMALWCLYPTCTALPFAILSGIAKDNDNLAAAAKWTCAQYASYFFFNSSFAIIGAYYGINFMLILRNSMKQFSRRSGGYYQSNSNATRNALDTLKYTMTYIAVLPMISGPWWGIYGLYHDTITNSINGVNLFLSTMWHITGAQPLIAVTQYVLLKRIYQHYTGQAASNDTNTSGVGSMKRSNMSPTSPTFSTSPTSPTFPTIMNPAFIKQNQQDRRTSDSTIDFFYDVESSFQKAQEEDILENNKLSPAGIGFPDWDNFQIPSKSSERNV